MSKTKVTHPVYDLLIKANDLLAVEQGSADFRRGVIAMIESVLHASGNYKGFNFIGWAIEGGCDRWMALKDPSADKRPYIGDETRRFYYFSREMNEVSKKMYK